MKKIVGYAPVRNGQPISTAKAVLVSVKEVDGEALVASSAWLPKSVASDLRIVREVEHGIVSYKVTANVPAWWVKQLDTRTCWQHAGMQRAPMAQRPW